MMDAFDIMLHIALVVVNLALVVILIIIYRRDHRL